MAVETCGKVKKTKKRKNVPSVPSGPVPSDLLCQFFTRKERNFWHTWDELRMPFSPDIIVTGEDTPRILLAAEAKLFRPISPEDVSRLKTYMLQMRCPIGLLVTPDAIELFRDTYTAHSENSVEHIASLPSPKTWHSFKGTHRASNDPELAFQFEQAVKSWLEELGSATSAFLGESPKETRETLTDYVLPALAQGVVRSTGPRASLTSR
jgi:hypothetical protein